MEFRKAQEIQSYKHKLREEIEEMIGQEASNEDMIDKCQQHMVSSNNSLGNVDITILVSFGVCFLNSCDAGAGILCLSCGSVS